MGGSQGEVGVDAVAASFGAAAKSAEVVEPGVGPLHDPSLADLDRRRHAAGGDLPEQPSLLECFLAGPVVIAGVQMHRRADRQRSEVLEGVEGRRQQGVVDGVGRRGHRGYGDAGAVGELGAFEPALAPVHGAATGASPPHGALVVHPSTASSASSKPIIFS